MDIGSGFGMVRKPTTVRVTDSSQTALNLVAATDAVVGHGCRWSSNMRSDYWWPYNRPPWGATFEVADHDYFPDDDTIWFFGVPHDGQGDGLMGGDGDIYTPLGVIYEA